MSFVINLSKSYWRIDTIIFSPRMLKRYPLTAEKTAMKTVRIMNLIVPSMRSPLSLISSTIWPQTKGRKTNPRDDIPSEMFAMKNIILKFQVYLNNLLKVLPAFLAFFLSSFAFFYSYIREARVLVYSGFFLSPYSSSDEDDRFISLFYNLSYSTSSCLLCLLIPNPQKKVICNKFHFYCRKQP